MKKIKDLYSNGRDLKFKKPNQMWLACCNMTVEEFVTTKRGIRGIGHGSYKVACDIICRDGHFDRRKRLDRRR